MPSRSIGLGEALRRGFTLAWGSPGVVGLAFLAEVGRDVLSIGAGVSIAALVYRAVVDALGAGTWLLFADERAVRASLLGQILDGRAWIPLGAALILATLVAFALKLLWYAAAARRFSHELEGEAGSTLAGGAAALPRALSVAVLFIPIFLAIWVYQVTAIGAGTLLFLSAIGEQTSGFAGAFSLALAITLGTMLSFLADVMFRLALVRAVASELSPIESLLAALREVGRMFPSLLGISLVFGVLGTFAGTISASGGAFVIGTGAAALALALLVRFATGVAGSFVLAFLSSAELGAIAALDAGDRGVLPEPPPPPPPPPKPVPIETVLASEPVLETKLASEEPPK